MLTSRHEKAPESFDSEVSDHDYNIWVKFLNCLIMRLILKMTAALSDKTMCNNPFFVILISVQPSCKADRKMQFCLALQTDSRSLKAG